MMRPDGSERPNRLMTRPDWLSPITRTLDISSATTIAIAAYTSIPVESCFQGVSRSVILVSFFYFLAGPPPTLAEFCRATARPRRSLGEGGPPPPDLPYLPYPSYPPYPRPTCPTCPTRP